VFDRPPTLDDHDSAPALPAVEPSRLPTHRFVATLVTVYPPAAAPDAENRHSGGVFVPSPQPHCCNWRPGVAAPPGTSARRVLPTFSRLKAPASAWLRHCWRVAPSVHAAGWSSAPLSAEPSARA